MMTGDDVVGEQGDQIGRIFAHWAIVFIWHFYLYIFVPNAVISPFNTQTMHFKSFYTQQHCVSLKNLMPWRDSNPGLLFPEAGVMSTAPRRQGFFWHSLKITEATQIFWLQFSHGIKCNALS
jgi:hypothetical protein